MKPIRVQLVVIQLIFNQVQFIHTEPIRKTVVKETNRFSLIQSYILSVHEATVERKTPV